MYKVQTDRSISDNKPDIIIRDNDNGTFILTLRLLMSYIYIYIYMEHLFLMFLDNTQRRSIVGRTHLDE